MPAADDVVDSKSCCPKVTTHKIALYIGLGFLQLLCYALPYFLAIWHVVDKFKEETIPQNVSHERDHFLHGLDVTAGFFWNIMIAIFVGLVTVALVVYFAIKVSWPHAREWWRPSIAVYVIFCLLPVMTLFAVTYKVYAPKIPCSVVKTHPEISNSNSTDNCSTVLGESTSSLQAAKFDSFDEWSMFILQVTLICLIINEWFAKFQEVKKGSEIEDVYPIIKQCGSEFFPLYDIATFQGLLLQRDVFANNALVVSIVAFTLLSTLKFVPTPPKDEFGKNKLKAERSRTYSACYYLNQVLIQDIPYLLVRIYIMASLRNGRTLNELVFSFKNAFYIAWYLLLIVLLFIAAEKAEDEMEIHVVEVQKNVTDIMRENVKRSRKQRAYLQDTEASLQNPVHGEKPRRSKNGNLHSLLLDETVKDGQEKVRKSRRKKSEKSGHRKRKDEGTVLDESAEVKRREHRRKKKKGVSPRPKISPETTNEKDESSHDARFILSRDLHPV